MMRTERSADPSSALSRVSAWLQLRVLWRPAVALPGEGWMARVRPPRVQGRLDGESGRR